MKTAKFLMIVTMLSITTLIYSESQSRSGVIKISLNQAIQNPEFTKAIYNQVDMATLLSNEQEGPYVARIVFKARIYAVYGTYNEWVNFFLMDLKTNNKIILNRQ